MVSYKCERCKKVFNQKCRYNDHKNRKIRCLIKNDIDDKYNDNFDYYCESCDKHFGRSDTLKRHLSSQLHKKRKKAMINNSNVKTNNGIINQIIGDKNKIVINKHYHISAFGKEEIDELTPEEKLAIFTSDTNPIVMIIIKTNLNSSMPQYHNVGYTNMNLGWGYIYNGETWEKKEIQAIMNDLLNSKRNDLVKIYKEIRDYLSEEQNKYIKTKMDDINKNVEPKFEREVRSKKRLVFDLKHF